MYHPRVASKELTYLFTYLFESRPTSVSSLCLTSVCLRPIIDKGVVGTLRGFFVLCLDGWDTTSYSLDEVNLNIKVMGCQRPRLVTSF